MPAMMAQVERGASLDPHCLHVLSLAHVGYWHKADMLNAPTNVRFEGNRGHRADFPPCRLMIPMRTFRLHAGQGVGGAVGLASRPPLP